MNEIFLTSRYRLPFELSLTMEIKINRNHSCSEARRVEIIHDRAILAAREWHREGKRSAPGLVPNGAQEHSAQDIRDEWQVEGRSPKG